MDDYGYNVKAARDARGISAEDMERAERALNPTSLNFIHAQMQSRSPERRSYLPMR